MFQRGRKPLREGYDEQFMRGPGNGREVTFHRVVNVVERRSPMQMMGGDFDRRGLDGALYNEPMPYQDPRECQGNNNYPQNDMQFFENEAHRYGNFHRNAPPPRNEGHYAHNRDDLRHHLDSRNNGRGGNYFRNRDRDSAREDVDYRRREQFTYSRDRSPVRRGNHSSNSASRPSEKSSSQQKQKPTASASPPHGNPEENLPQTPTTSKDYRQDCETFRTVVKMLVEKEPSLDYLLQAPMEKNLEEIKERCLDSLKQFIKELDEAIEQPSNTDPPTEGQA